MPPVHRPSGGSPFAEERRLGLESEILANGWLACPADAGLIFDPDFERKYDRALAILGVDEGRLSSDAGRA